MMDCFFSIIFFICLVNFLIIDFIILSFVNLLIFDFTKVSLKLYIDSTTMQTNIICKCVTIENNMLRFGIFDINRAIRNKLFFKRSTEHIFIEVVEKQLLSGSSRLHSEVKIFKDFIVQVHFTSRLLWSNWWVIIQIVNCLIFRIMGYVCVGCRRNKYHIVRYLVVYHLNSSSKFMSCQNYSFTLRSVVFVRSFLCKAH